MKTKFSLLKIIYHFCVIAIGVLMIYPIAWMISGSFKSSVELLNSGLSLVPEEFYPLNYATGWAGFGGITFGTFFANSLIVCILATLFTVISSSLIAFGFARLRFPGRNFWFTIMLMTMMLPGQILMIPQYVIFNKLGWINTYYPLIIPHLGGSAFFIFLMMQFVQGLPYELDEAAVIDGCSPYMTYLRVILPLIGPSLVTTTVIQFYWKWDEFLSSLLYLSRVNKFTVSVAIKAFADASSTTDYGAMFAMSTLSLIPVFLIFLFFNRFLIEGVATSGLKA